MTLTPGPQDRVESTSVANRLLAVARALLTVGTLLVVLPVLVGAVADINSDYPGQRQFLAIHATVFPLVAVLYTVPTFRIGQYLLNGGIAVLSFPLLFPMLYPPEGTREVPLELMVAALMSGPALLSLVGTALVWGAVRWMRSW